MERTNSERLDRMRRAMEAARLDALVLRLPENVLLLSGFWPMIGATTLVFCADGGSTAIVPDQFQAESAAALWEADTVYYRFGLLDAPDPVESVRSALAQLFARGKWKRIGYEASFGTLAPSWQSGEILAPTERTRDFYSSVFDSAELVDASTLLQVERRTKTTREADKLRIASEISCLGLEAFRNAVEPGISGVELVALVEREIMAKGSGYKNAARVRGYAQVATGTAETSIGYRMHEISTTRRLQPGDAALLELGVVADGFWADRTRIRVAGNSTDQQIRIVETLIRAQKAAFGAVRPGATGADVDDAARSVIRDAGFGAFFPHITGHGLGFAYHESSPILGPRSQTVLEAGMLTSVEPGIYSPEWGGFRIEDDVLVTQNGCEILGEFARAVSG